MGKNSILDVLKNLPCQLVIRLLRDTSMSNLERSQIMVSHHSFGVAHVLWQQLFGFVFDIIHFPVCWNCDSCIRYIHLVRSVAKRIALHKNFKLTETLLTESFMFLAGQLFELQFAHLQQNMGIFWEWERVFNKKLNHEREIFYTFFLCNFTRQIN